MISWDSIAAKTPDYINFRQKVRNRHSTKTTSKPRRFKAQGASCPGCGMAVKCFHDEFSAEQGILSVKSGYSCRRFQIEEGEGTAGSRNLRELRECFGFHGFLDTGRVRTGWGF